MPNIRNDSGVIVPANPDAFYILGGSGFSEVTGLSYQSMVWRQSKGRDHPPVVVGPGDKRGSWGHDIIAWQQKPRVDKAWVPCESCGRSFRGERGLRVHRRRIHGMTA